MVFQQLQLAALHAIRQQQFVSVGIENALRVTETAQQRQTGLIPQALQLRQPHPVFQHIRRLPVQSFRAASHSSTVAAAAAFSDSQCSLIGILIVRSQRASTPSVSPRPSLPMAMAQRR